MIAILETIADSIRCHIIHNVFPNPQLTRLQTVCLTIMETTAHVLLLVSVVILVHIVINIPSDNANNLLSEVQYAPILRRSRIMLVQQQRPQRILPILQRIHRLIPQLTLQQMFQLKEMFQLPTQHFLDKLSWPSNKFFLFKESIALLFPTAYHVRVQSLRLSSRH